jgi:hypothetical protein
LEKEEQREHKGGNRHIVSDLLHITRTSMPLVAITDTRKHRQKFTSRLWKKRNKENEKGDNRHFVLDLLP